MTTPEATQSVEFWADNVQLFTDTAPPFVFNLDTRGFSNGTHRLGFGWTDASGVRRTPQVGEVIVDNAVAAPPPPTPHPPGPPPPIKGTSKSEVLEGTSRAETIRAGGGNDTVLAKGGDDVVYGSTGRDLLFGGAGDDLLDGEAGADRISAGSGSDVIRARDEIRDVVTCGRGPDIVIADRRDRVAKSCDVVRMR